jgi:hypothetical protein
LQQAVTAGTYIRNGDVGLARRDGTKDVDPRLHGSMDIAGPAQKRKDAPWCERHDTPMAVDYVLLVDPAEPDPVLDALLDPQQVDVGEVGRGVDRTVMQTLL